MSAIKNYQNACEDFKKDLGLIRRAIESELEIQKCPTKNKSLSPSQELLEFHFCGNDFAILFAHNHVISTIHYYLVTISIDKPKEYDSFGPAIEVDRDGILGQINHKGQFKEVALTTSSDEIVHHFYTVLEAQLLDMQREKLEEESKAAILL